LSTLVSHLFLKWCSKSVRVIFVIYITVLGRTDFEHPIFSIVSSQSFFYRDGPFIKNVSFVETRKNVIYSKLVNNPFNVLTFHFRLLKPFYFKLDSEKDGWI